MKTPGKVLSAFRRDARFLIATHINPDGDAIGSSVALACALEAIGKKVLVYDRDPVPKIYRFMPGHGKFRTDIRNMLKSDPVLVLLDCNAPDRAGLEGFSFRSSIVIDHHETESDFGDIRWIRKDAAATGLLIHYLIKALGVALTRDMAENLYTAISVDTGTFRYSNTTAGVLTASAELVKAGAEPNVIAESLYETWDYKRFRLFLLSMNTLEKKNGIAITRVTREMFRKTGTKPEDTEQFSNFPRKIDSVKMSAMFRELGGNQWKASLRAKGAVNVAAIAETFGGGGHRNAAGYKTEGDFACVRRALLQAVRKLEGDKKT
ncbi:MAG: bifunctional oligoribonuclease/PAP phosphatase NrnA [Nitrospirae bacterium]|nr:bifunctional oligoribonuclease/PAP phosphatase NrnA [Nitrospirota bacterium]